LHLRFVPATAIYGRAILENFLQLLEARNPDEIDLDFCIQKVGLLVPMLDVAEPVLQAEEPYSETPHPIFLLTFLLVGVKDWVRFQKRGKLKYV
jgi:hypothetical protein